MSKEYPIQNVAEKIIKGEVPSNEQLDSALERAEEALEKSTKDAHLNVHGQALANDAMKILESTKKIIDEKNLGDHLKKLAELGATVGEKVGETAHDISHAQGTLSRAMDASTMKGEITDIMNDIRKLVYYSIHSSEFRSILVDAIELLQYSLNLTKEKVMEASEKLKQTISEKVPEQPVSYESSQAYPVWYVNSTATQLLPTIRTETEAPKHSQSEFSDIYEQKLLHFRKKFDSLADKVSRKREYREIYDRWTSIVDNLGVQLKKLGYTSGKVVEQVEGKMEELSEDNEIKKTWNELKSLVEGFSGRGSVDNLMIQISGLLDEFNNNPNVSEFFHSLKIYLNKILEDPSLRLGQVTVTQEFRDLVDKLYTSLDGESIRNGLNELVSSSQAMLQSIKTDVASNELMNSLAQFGKDFALDFNNKPSPSLIQDSLVQLKNLLVPLIKQQIIALKIPKISKSNDTYDFSIESLSIHMEDIIPSQIRITTKSFMGLDVQKFQMTATRGLIVLKIKELKAKFTDLHFSYDRKVLPRISDSGVADVDLTRGRGMSAKIVWKITESKEGLLALHLDTVNCKIDNLSIQVKKSNHHVLENLAITLFGGWVKNAVAESVVNSIVETILPLEESINGIFKEISFKHFVENANAKLQDVYEKGTESQPIKAVKEAAKVTLEGAKQAAQTITETVTSVPEKLEEITEKVMEAAVPMDISKTEEIQSGLQIPSRSENQPEIQYPESISSGSMTWYRNEEVLDPVKKMQTQTDEILHKSFGGGVMIVGEIQESYESSESYEESETIEKEAQGGFTTEKKESEIISEILEPAERLSRLETHVPAPKESPSLPLENPSISDERAFDTTTQVGFSHDESKLPYFINPNDVLTLPKTEERTAEKNPEEKHAK